MNLIRCAIPLCLAAGMLPGCGGAQLPMHAPGGLTAEGDRAAFGAPGTTPPELLYVTDNSYASYYAYPQGKLAGKLTGFTSAVGDCADSEGNVFIPDQVAAQVYEYPHGSTKRIADLQTHVSPAGCAIDPVTGDLAVSGGAPKGGGVDIFKGAKGSATFYKAPQFFSTQFCGFDAKGNLFVDGLKDTKGNPMFAELPKGSHTFKQITLNATIDGSGGVQWDGKDIAVGGYIPPKGNNSKPVIYRFAITGTQGKKVGTTMLGSPAHFISFQFAIAGATVIVPNWYFEGIKNKYDVLFYKYPAGGAPTKTLTGGISMPHGAAISRDSASL